MNYTWETIETSDGPITRLAVPGGWLVRLGDALTCIADPDHQWTVVPAPDPTPEPDPQPEPDPTPEPDPQPEPDPTFTRYLALDGDDTNLGTSDAPWGTLGYALTHLVGGDTLVIRPGEYEGEIRSYYGDGFPSGLPDRYTTIRAEQDWTVTVRAPLEIHSANHFVLQGMHLVDCSETINCHHAKFVRCSFRGGSPMGNSCVVAVATGSHDVLFEDCFAYGYGRYKFMAYGDQNTPTERIVFRRCVARHDHHEGDWARQCATFVSYDAHDVAFQNCIAIDSGVDRAHGTLYGALWFENKETTGLDNSGVVQDCILLNIGGLAAINDPKNNGVRRITNTVMWDCAGGYMGGVKSGSPTLELDHMTIGRIHGTRSDESYAWGTGAVVGSGFPNNPMVRNSLITQCNSSGVANGMNSEHNRYWDNAEDFGSTWAQPRPTPGPGDEFGPTPMPHLLSQPDKGATIMYQRGRSGTLWGEPGWDELTTTPLWPFPCETVIRATMATWDGQNPGQRGFCAPGTALYGGPITLSSYVWEYLGEPCPLYG